MTTFVHHMQMHPAMHRMSPMFRRSRIGRRNHPMFHGIGHALATQGRNGDDMLVHMSAPEVKSLAAMSPTGTLSQNPSTGLPEAFSLKDILPWVAGIGGALLAPELGISAALGSAVGSGVTTAATTGDLGKGLASGLLSYGLGSALNGLSGSDAVQSTGSALNAAKGAGFDPTSVGTPLTPGAPTTPLPAGIGPQITGIGTTPASIGNPFEAGTAQGLTSPGDGGMFGQYGQAFKNLSGPNAGQLLKDTFIGNATNTTLPIALGLAGMGVGAPKAPSTSGSNDNSGFIRSGQHVPPFQRNYNTPGGGYQHGTQPEWNFFTYPNGFLPPGFAAGGQVGPLGNWLTSMLGNLRATGQNIPAGMTPPQAFAGVLRNSFAGLPGVARAQQQAPGASRPGILGRLAGVGRLGGTMQSTIPGPGGLGMPGGAMSQGIMSPGASGGNAAPSGPDMPFILGGDAGPGSPGGPGGGPGGGAADAAGAAAGAFAQGGPIGQPQGGGDSGIQLIQATMLALTGKLPNPEPVIATFLRFFGPQALAQLKAQIGTQHGMVNGAGTGQSDDVPAMIDSANGASPARLSDGEFVVPADVVSALGSGSSDAGARALHQMMSRVRQQQYGSNRQPAPMDSGAVMPV